METIGDDGFGFDDGGGDGGDRVTDESVGRWHVSADWPSIVASSTSLARAPSGAHMDSSLRACL